MSSYLREEKKLWKNGFKKVIGLDEAGRGPLAGPVTAAAVTIRQIPNSTRQLADQIPKIQDSKKLSPEKREEFYKILTKYPDIQWGIGRVSEKIIDKINILEATKLAMARALKNLEKRSLNKNRSKKNYVRKSHDREIFCNTLFLILDGNFTLPTETLAKVGINPSIHQKPIIKADEKVFSCVAASIIAKVTRDRIMKKYHKKYPRYGFNRHKGYPTKFHFIRIKKYGPCNIHRRSFHPCKVTVRGLS